MRSETLDKELKRVGKVGGIYDRRLGARDKYKTNEEKLLQRHIVEKLRQLSDVPFDESDNSDPLIKAAFYNKSTTKFCNEIEVEGGIGGSENVKGCENFKDALSKKIAITKLERLKRVEENEEHREKLKTVDTEWNKNIRFLMSNIPTLKRKESSDQKKNNANVVRLLEELNCDKKIIPIGSRVISKENFQESQLTKLEHLLKSGKIDVTIDDQSNEEVSQEKTVGHLLRILLKISSQEQITITFLATQLYKAQYRSIKDVIHYILIVQLLLEHCQMKFDQKSQEKLLTSEPSGNLAFCPEIVHALFKMLHLACLDTTTSSSSNNDNANSTGESNKLLLIHEAMTNVNSSDYATMNIKMADPSFNLLNKQLSTVRLSCIHRLLELTRQVCELYEKFVSKFVLMRLFEPFEPILKSLMGSSLYPPGFGEQIQEILDWIEWIRNAPTPNFLIANRRLTFLSNKELVENGKMLKKIGLLPQLEPSFDECLAVRLKKTDVTRMLKRKIAKEKRSTMRDIKRDSHHLASNQLKRIREIDSVREKKTKVILASLRSIED